MAIFDASEKPFMSSAVAYALFILETVALLFMRTLVTIAVVKIQMAKAKIIFVFILSRFKLFIRCYLLYRKKVKSYTGLKPLKCFHNCQRAYLLQSQYYLYYQQHSFYKAVEYLSNALKYLSCPVIVPLLQIS